MRPSESLENQRWAKQMAYKHTREFPQHKADIDQEALLGLVKAEAHRDCPGDDEFQAFAFSFVRSAICDFTRKLRRHSEVGPETFELELVLAKDEEPCVDEWEDVRLSLADQLHGSPRLVFLMVYGETEYTHLPEVANRLNLSSSWVKKHHVTALEALRDLPCIQQVA